MSCSVVYNVYSYPSSWLIDLQPNEEVCFNSSSIRTVYAIGHSPSDLNVEVLQEDKEVVNISSYSPLSENNTLLFIPHKVSSVSIKSITGGNTTVSAITLGKGMCTSGVMVTNQILNYTLPLYLQFSHRKCCFFRQLRRTERYRRKGFVCI